MLLAEELGGAVERGREALLGACWNAQAPDDRESAARMKVVADVGADGRVAGWQVHEIPETRRPELADCVRTVIARAAPELSPPGRPAKAAAFVHFP